MRGLAATTLPESAAATAARIQNLQPQPQFGVKGEHPPPGGSQSAAEICMVRNLEVKFEIWGASLQVKPSTLPDYMIICNAQVSNGESRNQAVISCA